MGCREGLCPFSGLWVLVDKNLLLGGLRQKPDAGWNLDKNRDKPRICFPSLRLAFHPYKALRERVLVRLYLNAKLWHDVPLGQ